MDNLSDNWRERLETALKDAGRSKRDVSLAAGLGPNYLHEVLTLGKEPSIKNLIAIAATLNTSVAFLIGEAAA
jgi:lambda repressor-like predicted transcriptional regulator